MRIVHDREKKPKIYIAIPCYSGQQWYKNSISVLQSVLAINQIGWDCRVDYIPRDCMIHSVRNKFVAEFMHSDCSHLFMIDDDISFDFTGIIKMVNADKEVISGMVPIRQTTRIEFAGEVVADCGDLVELKKTGGAFLCIKRSAIEKMIKKYPGLRCLAFDSYGDYGYSFFEFLHKNGTLFGEDVTFCNRWREIGKIYGYKNIKFEHLSEDVITGNYDESLLKFGVNKCD